MNFFAWSTKIGLFLIFFIVSGCTPYSTPTTAISIPTNTTVATNTIVPTNTPEPTRTPIPPTATVAVPDKLLEYLDGAEVVHIDTFNDSSGGGWGFDAGTIKNDVLEVVGKNWNGLVRDRQFKEYEAIIVDFIYTKGSVFEMLFDTGEWQTPPYKRFGIYIDNNSPRANVWQGVNGLGFNNLFGNFSPKPDITYSLLIAVLPDGEFLGVIWNPSDTTQTVFYREKFPETWSGLTWTFKIGADFGTILFDNFREIKFEAAK